MDEIFEVIKGHINGHDVVLYMKGTSTFPQCGFSATVATILNRLKVNFLDINVLEDNAIREAIKTFTDWPTIPQLYIKGEFIGGCDIVKELYQSGELQQILTEKGIIIASDAL